MTENGEALLNLMQLQTFHSAPAELPLNTSSLARWFAVQTYSRHEKTVVLQLEQEGIQTMLPLARQERKWSDRKKVLDLPLFPGYVFVRLSDFSADRFCVLRKKGIVGFVGNNHDAPSIPEEEILNIQLLTKNGVPASPHPYLRVGQRVRIRDGSLCGLEGILVRIANDHSMVLSIDLIQRSVSIRVEGYSLEVL